MTAVSTFRLVASKQVIEYNEYNKKDQTVFKDFVNIIFTNCTPDNLIAAIQLLLTAEKNNGMNIKSNSTTPKNEDDFYRKYYVLEFPKGTLVPDEMYDFIEKYRIHAQRNLG